MDSSTRPLHRWRDSRRDVNALLDDFKNSHDHFFKCLAWQLRCVSWCFNKSITNHVFVENPQRCMLFQVCILNQHFRCRFFVGWILVTKDGHSLWWRGICLETMVPKRRAGFSQRREPMNCICYTATYEPDRGREWVLVILNSKLIPYKHLSYFIIFHST